MADLNLDRDRFMNSLRILYSIDHDEIASIIDGLTVGAWERFRDNPAPFLLRCADKTAAAILTIIERRQPPRLTPVNARADLVAALQSARAFIQAEYDARLAGAWEAEHPYLGDPRTLINEIDAAIAKEGDQP